MSSAKICRTEHVSLEWIVFPLKEYIPNTLREKLCQSNCVREVKITSRRDTCCQVAGFLIVILILTLLEDLVMDLIQTYAR